MKKNLLIFIGILCSTFVIAQSITVALVKLDRRADDNNGVYGEAIAIDI
jgi:hypothetical protein